MFRYVLSATLILCVGSSLLFAQADTPEAGVGKSTEEKKKDTRPRLKPDAYVKALKEW